MQVDIPFITLTSLALVTGSASAAVTYTAQSRGVESGSLFGSYAHDVAPDFGPYLVQLSSPQAYDLYQDSRLDPTEILMSGYAAATGRDRAGGSWFSWTSSSSIYIEFSLDVATPFAATIGAGGMNTWSMTAELDPYAVGGPVFSGQGNFSGILAPGIHIFTARIEATTLTIPIDGVPSIGWPAVESSGFINARLSLPSPGAAPCLIAGVGLASRRRRPTAT